MQSVSNFARRGRRILYKERLLSCHRTPNGRRESVPITTVIAADRRRNGNGPHALKHRTANAPPVAQEHRSVSAIPAVPAQERRSVSAIPAAPAHGRRNVSAIPPVPAHGRRSVSAIPPVPAHGQPVRRGPVRRGLPNAVALRAVPRPSADAPPAADAPPVLPSYPAPPSPPC